MASYAHACYAEIRSSAQHGFLICGGAGWPVPGVKMRRR
jgi:hypothetical protein